MYKLCKFFISPFIYILNIINFIKTCIFNILGIVLIFFILKLCLQTYCSPFLPKKGALLMDLTGTVIDCPPKNHKMQQIGHKFFSSSINDLQNISLFDVVNIIRQAKNDNNITGIVLSLKNFYGSDQASLQYIGKALIEFKKSNKPIYAIGNNYSQSQYFLASYADKIYLTPQGMVDLHGLSINHLYYKTFLKNLKIKSHIFREGMYKSAVEPFLRDNMSEVTRKNDAHWLNQLWQNYLKIVSNNRKLTPEQLFPEVNSMINKFRHLEGNSAKFALNSKWVDIIASQYEIGKDLSKKFGWNEHNKDFNNISMYDYKLNTNTQDNKNIAVIITNGMITEGPEMTGVAVGDIVADQIHDARLDPKIKAIILRINSPGGSISGSEVIRSELSAAHKSGKPIVVSMGGLAASGGYWISTPANYIIASNNTLTGSIGVFGIINTIEDLLASIGVHSDGISTSPLAGASSIKNMPMEFAQMMQININKDYKKFVSLVAKSRHKTFQAIDKIAKGRVWIGKDALKNGLIDQLGDFDDAIKKTIELAHLTETNLKWYGSDANVLDFINEQMPHIMYSMIPNILQSKLSTSKNIINQLEISDNIRINFNDPKNIYAFCPSCIVILN